MTRSDLAIKYNKISQILLFVSGCLVLISIVLLVGFYLDEFWIKALTILNDICIYIFIANEIIKFSLTANYKEHFKERWLELLLIVFLLLQIFFPSYTQIFFELILPNVAPNKLALLYIAFLSIIIIFMIFLKVVRITHTLNKIKIHSSGLLALSFLAIILLGSLLLYLPRSYVSEDYTYLDALFTSTSAVCVTGLTSVDTEFAFTKIGKFFIIFLIQIGGLGIMTLTTFFAFYLTGGVSLTTRALVKDMVSEENVGEIKSILFKILKYTLIIEGIGTLLLYIATVDNVLIYEPDKFYHALFHSISAFCNAGFSLHSENLMYPALKDNYLYTSTIMSLIILGGLGFIVHSNLYEFFSRKRQNKAFRLKIHTKISVITTFSLVLFGAIFIMMFEPNLLYPNFTFFEKFYQSLFWSVSARTAGFNIMPVTSISQASAMMMILLMWIGASPGSTGGGVKTTTITIVIIALFNYIKGKNRSEIFHREISPVSIRQAFFVILASLIILGFASTILMWIEPDKNALDLIFEVTSAHSTVGLTRNITGFLGDGGKLLIISVMYIGRIGVLAFFLSFHAPSRETNFQLPKENIFVG